MKINSVVRENREAYYGDRLTAQLNFAKRLSKENKGKWQDVIEKAESFVSDACKDNSPITPSIVSGFEEILMPLNEEAKSYKIICTSHAHIDMNWQWGWDETVAIVIDTTITMLKLLEEYPEFYFSLSQASTYKILKDYAPELFEKVKAYVHEGRWEVTAPSWVECDKNMPSGESLAMQIYSAKKYLSEMLEIDPDRINVDFQPDTFGHSLFVPEILASAGVKYYYHCRGTNSPYTLYRWQAPSGSEILVNRENNFYSSPVRSDMGLVAIEVAKKQGLKTTLRVYGVGDHGGGPSRRDIERLMDMNSWCCFPTFKLGTYKEFFEEIEKNREIIPVVKGEINFVCDGCYSSQSRIKAENKLCENALYSAEAFAALSKINGNSVKTDYNDPWQKVLLTHFHDIITGSGIEATRHHAMGEYQEVLGHTKSGSKLAIKAITDRINTADILNKAEINIKTGDKTPFAGGAGAGSGQAEEGVGLRRVYHVFNSLTSPSERAVSIMLWDWTGDTDKLIVTDVDGRKLPHQIMSKGFNGYWGHHFVDIRVYLSVKSLGYTTIVVDEDEKDNIFAEYWPEKKQQWQEKFILENEYLRVEFNSQNGALENVIDKASQDNYTDFSRENGIFRLITEANHKEISHWGSEMSGWFVGRYKNIENIQQNCEMSLNKGEVTQAVTMEFAFNDSKIVCTVSLDKGSRVLKYKAQVHWLETGSQEKGTPQLSFYMPLKAAPKEFTFDVPFGTTDREGVDYDLPGLTFASSGDVAIFSKHTYGFRCYEDNMSLTLLRSGFDPDPYPECGLHEIEFALGFGIEDKEKLINASREFNTPLTVASNYSHGGDMPLNMEGIKVEGPQVTAVRGGNNKTTIRMYEALGVATEAVVTMPCVVKAAWTTDINGNRLQSVNHSGNTVRLEVGKNKIITLEIEW